MANKKTREREINAAKVKVYENKKNSLKILSPISIAIIAVTVLLMFVPFIEIMNDPSRAGQTGAAFVEQEGANGFTCLIIALTRDYHFRRIRAVAVLLLDYNSGRSAFRKNAHALFAGRVACVRIGGGCRYHCNRNQKTRIRPVCAGVRFRRRGCVYNGVCGCALL